MEGEIKVPEDAAAAVSSTATDAQTRRGGRGRCKRAWLQDKLIYDLAESSLLPLHLPGRAGRGCSEPEGRGSPTRPPPPKPNASPLLWATEKTGP